MKEQLRTALYARYSSDNQRDASIEDQLRVCREYCEKHNLVIVEEYCDHALTGLTDKRPQFQRMIADGQHHHFEALVLYAIDRFSRDRYDSAVYKHILKKAGVRIMYATQDLGDGAEAILMEGVLETLANYYSANLARNVRRGLEGNALKGIFTSSRPPLGYKLSTDRHLLVDELTAPIVREVFERYAQGDSIVSIINSLNERAVKTSWGKPFNRNSISHILHNEAYIGVFKWADIRLENAITPIISTELWQRTRTALQRNKIARSRTKSDEDFILTGKAFCAHCGALYAGDSGTARNGVTHYYYTCHNHKLKRKCPAHSVRKEVLEAIVLKEAKKQLTEENIRAIAQSAAEYCRREAEKNDRTPLIKKQLAETETKIANIMKAIEMGVITETTTARLKELESDQKALKSELVKEQAPHAMLTEEHFAFYLSQFIGGADDDEALNNKILEQFINTITIEELPNGDKKIGLLFNLKNNPRVIITGSSYEELMGLTSQDSNHVIFVSQTTYLVCLTLRRAA